MERTPLLLLPGMMTNAAVWQEVLPALQEIADVRIADFTTQDSIEAMATSALALVNDAQPVAIAGFSMGGFVAAEMLRQAPERIARMALIDTSVRTETPRMAEGREKMIAAAKADFQAAVIDKSDANLHPDHRGDTRIIDIIKKMARDIGLDTYVRQNYALMRRGDYRAELAAVDVPVTILCGTSDEMTPPKLSEELAELIPGASLEWIDPAGHMTLLEQPGQVAEALRRWWQQ